MARRLLLLTVLCYGLGLFLFPQAAGAGARQGLLLCGQVILPALFPFFVLSNLALGLGFARWLGEKLAPVMGPLFHVGGAGAAALALGMVGGYPAGAAALRELMDRGLCSRAEGQRLLAFCNNAGPAFVLSVAGVSVFGSLAAGLLLLAVHLISALGVGLLLRGRGRPRAVPYPPPETMDAAALLPQAVGKALSSSLQVSAYVVLFSVFLALLEAAGGGLPLPAPLAVLGTGLLELSNGICALSQVSSPALRLALAGFLLGWGGLSVHCQTAALLEGSGLDLLPYLGGKLLQGLLSAGLLLLLSPLCQGALPVWTGEGEFWREPASLSMAAGCGLWAALLLTLINWGGNDRRKRV